MKLYVTTRKDSCGTATYLTDINGLAYEFFLNLPFGETMAEQHSQTADYVNRWKFTGHELDRETGLYYANARFFDPRISIFLSVDMLAEQAPGWTPYHYTWNNPVRFIDPDGMWPRNPLQELKRIANATVNNFKQSVKEKTTAVVNYVTGEDKYQKIPSKSPSTVKEKTVNKAANAKSCLDRGPSKVDINQFDSNLKEAIKYDLPERMQEMGNNMAIAGYGLTLTGVGAEVGVPLAAVGNGLSGIGAGLEITVSLIDGDLGKGGTKLGLMVADKVIEKGLNKALPGSANVFDKNFNLDKAILTQGASLKVGVADKIIQNQTEIQK